VAEAAIGHDQAERPTCWCCGNTFDDADLTRLGAHPEVGVCVSCARWLHRRARSASDQGKRRPDALLRQGIVRVRGRLMRAGAHEWPLVGPLLRRLDRHLP
jgi:hypothetical protein